MKKLTTKHKQAIAASLSKETPELIAKIRELRDHLPLRKLAIEAGISNATLCRMIKRHNIKLSKEGRARATDASREVHLGKTPWNKDGHLSEETKARISQAISGKKNGQYGRGMTEEEKEKWRESWNNGGKEKFLVWRFSTAGIDAQTRSNETLKSAKCVLRASEKSGDLMRKGKLKYRGKGKTLNTKKGGKFRTKSTYETKYVAILEDDANVVRFIYEPFRIPYYYDGRKRNYIPDFLVEYIDGHEKLVEVKPSRLVNLPKNRAKIRAGQNHEIEFVVITETEIGL